MRVAWIGAAIVGAMIPTSSMGQQVQLIGTESCATSTCHGGVVGQGPAWNHSLSTWIANDPHAGAGLLLRDEDSRAIVVQLNPAAADSPETFDTVLRNRCISCHATPTPQQCSEDGLLEDDVLSQGVSCEACHGAASKWLDPHIRVDWTGPMRFEPETGMRDTESTIGRAETCVRCHVGSRTQDGLVRDMNHDLIAAGHPALRFDLLIYNENLAKHWDLGSASEQTFSESAVRLRNVGRAVSLSAAAELSSERASAHLIDPIVPWPELADYDCFACHQALSIREYKLPPSGQTKSSLHVSDGLPIWNAWHSVNNEFDLRDNRQALETLSPHRSDPAKIVEIGKRIASKYRALAVTRLSESPSAQETIAEIKQQLLQRPPVDWHQAAIQFLQIDAGLRDLAKVDSAATLASQAREALRVSERGLRFDPDRRDNQAARYHSPANFDPDAFRSAVLKSFNIQPAAPAP